MKKTIINENQRGFLFKNGKYVKMLEPGKHYVCGEKTVEVVDMQKPISLMTCSLDIVLKDPDVEKEVSVVEVADNELSINSARANAGRE